MGAARLFVVRLIATSTLREFWLKHPDAEPSLSAWAAEASRAKWADTSDVKARYATASFVGKNRVIFNIAGNKYRLVVAMRYAEGIAYVCFIGTHAEYDAIDPETVRNY